MYGDDRVMSEYVRVFVLYLYNIINIKYIVLKMLIYTTYIENKCKCKYVNLNLYEGIHTNNLIFIKLVMQIRETCE